jgi:hypothetical protein
VHWSEHLNRLELDYNQIFYKQVYDIGPLNSQALIAQCDWNLSSDVIARKSKFVFKTLLIGAFEHSRSQDAMHFNGAANDVIRQFVETA